MSFYINNSELKEAYFNGSEVSSIYYNGTLIWEAKWRWPGWSNATWEDISLLCKAKQSGEIAEWPSDVVLGATKTTTLSTAVLGSKSVSMRVIGVDIDGEGTITFHSVDGLSTTSAFNSSGSLGWASVTDITAKTICKNFYNYCNAKKYIKTVSKGTVSGKSSTRNGTAIYDDETVFLLSEFEVGLDMYSQISADSATATDSESTYGLTPTPYPYYSSNDARVKSKGIWWLRSRKYNSTNNTCAVKANGGAYYYANTSTYYIAPAFVIG